MTTISRSALLPYESQKLFDLVNDIESYPVYMDGCVGAEVYSRNEELVEARLDLAKGGISHSFSTRNRLLGTELVTLELLDGPFDSFEGRWVFQALGDEACKLSLELEFSFNSTVLGVAASRLFEMVTNNLVDALARRARDVYG
jgi:ribosome-associated toxin RatA of RatAB toxin-antitoxin module